MHLHWKNHEAVKVVCKPCRPGQVHQYAEELSRLSKRIVIDIMPNNIIIFYRGRIMFNLMSCHLQILYPKLRLWRNIDMGSPWSIRVSTLKTWRMNWKNILNILLGIEKRKVQHRIVKGDTLL